MADVPAEDIRRGAALLLLDLGFVPMFEFGLANNRRADIAAIDRTGKCFIVEVKSSRADFQSDRKWPDYLEFCDLFAFAVAPGFPRELLPDDQGLILADRHQGELIRSPVSRPLAGGRRKALLVRFGRHAAYRALVAPAPIDPLAEPPEN